jgi:hypothetical protein
MELTAPVPFTLLDNPSSDFAILFIDQSGTNVSAPNPLVFADLVERCENGMSRDAGKTPIPKNGAALIATQAQSVVSNAISQQVNASHRDTTAKPRPCRPIGHAPG